MINEDGDYSHAFSGNMAMDSNGHMMMRMGDSTAMNMDLGELHIVSEWPDDENDN